MNDYILKAAKAALNELRKAAGGPPPPPPAGPPPGPQGPPPPPSTIPGGGNGAPVPQQSQAKPSLPATLQPGTQPGVQAANSLLAWLNNNKGKTNLPTSNH